MRCEMQQSYRAFSGSFARSGRPRGVSIDVPCMLTKELGLPFRLVQEAMNKSVVHRQAKCVPLPLRQQDCKIWYPSNG